MYTENNTYLEGRWPNFLNPLQYSYEDGPVKIKEQFPPKKNTVTLLTSVLLAQ